MGYNICVGDRMLLTSSRQDAEKRGPFAGGPFFLLKNEVSIYLVILLTLLYSELSHSKPFNFSILHTNDLHSYLSGVGSDLENTKSLSTNKQLIGHYARISGEINKYKSIARIENKAVLLLDAGDFFGGTLFHGLGPSVKTSSFPEYEFFKYHNYDAITLGNHEFDAKENGLMSMLEKINTKSDFVPIVSTNLEVSETDLLSKFYGVNKLISPYKVKEYSQNGQKVKVGYIGLLGADGCLVSRGNRGKISFKGFNDQSSKVKSTELYEEIQSTIDFLKKEKKVNIVIVLMHGGSPEDKNLAKEVSGIDVIIAGHTHEVYRDIVGDTIISQSGSYGRYLGVMELKYENSKVSLVNKSSSNVIEINNKSPVDKEYLKKLKLYKSEIDLILKDSPYKFNTKIFKSLKNYKTERELHNPLGIMVTSGIRNQLNKSEKNKIDVYFTSLSLVRSEFKKDHSYQYSDIFKMMPIGFGENQSIGSPIVSFYLSKKELYQLVSFMELYRHISSNFTPAFSGNLVFETRWWGIPLINRVSNIKLNGLDFKDWPELLNISTSSYVSRYVDMVEKVTYGAFRFVPKDINGNPLKNLNVNYPREHEVLAEYLKSVGEI